MPDHLGLHGDSVLKWFHKRTIAGVVEPFDLQNIQFSFLGKTWYRWNSRVVRDERKQGIFLKLWLPIQITIPSLINCTLTIRLTTLNFSGVLNFSIYSFIYSFIRSFIHSFIHSFVRSFIRSLINSFIRSFIRSFIHSFIRSSIRSFIRSFHRSFLRSFVHSFIRSFIDPFIHSFIH